MAEKIERPVLKGDERKFALKWIKALRSGKYEQGDGYLYYAKDDTYCCLGVAEILAGSSKQDLNEEVFPRTKGNLSKYPKLFTKDSSGYNLNCYLHKVRIAASDLNDSGVSFKKIANKIESWFQLKKSSAAGKTLAKSKK